MDYEISVAENRTYLRVDVHSPMTSELGRRCTVDVTNLGRQQNINRYLYDLRGAPNVQGMVQNYEFAYQDMADLGFPKDVWCALLTDVEDESHNAIATFFTNAGYKMRVFTDEPSAVAWLED